jgi:hypothetical protein
MSFQFPRFGRRGGDRQEAPQDERPDVALVFDDSRREVVFGLHTGGGPTVRRVPAARLRAELAAALSAASYDAGADGAAFLTCAPSHTEETAEPFLDGTQLALPDGDLLLLLAEAARTNAPSSAVQGAPVMPESAVDAGKTWDFARTPSSGVTVTSCARAALDDAATRIAAAALGFDPSAAGARDEEVYLEFRCETTARAVLRAQLASLPAGAVPSDEREVTALVAVTASGACVGLYSPVRGLFLEDAEPFQTGGEYDDPAVIAGSVAHALNNLSLRLAPAALSAIGFSGVNCVWWTASPALRVTVAREIAEFKEDYETRYAASYSEHSNQAFGDGVDLDVSLDLVQTAARRIEVLEAPRALEELAAVGLLLGAGGDGGLLAPINLADAAPERARSLADEREHTEAADLAVLQRRVRAAAFIPILLVLGLIFGGYITTLWEAHRLDQSLERETEEQARLAPVAARREGANQVLTWVGSYLDQVAELRRKQPASLSLLAALDERYPIAEDESFTVKSLVVEPNGQVEIQGLTKKDDAVIAFVTSLEYSPTDESGRKLFESPVYELRKPQVGGINLPSPPAGQGNPFPTQVSSARPDVTAFTVRATYTPLQRDSAVSAPAKGGPDAK